MELKPNYEIVDPSTGATRLTESLIIHPEDEDLVFPCDQLVGELAELYAKYKERCDSSISERLITLTKVVKRIEDASQMAVSLTLTASEPEPK